MRAGVIAKKMGMTRVFTNEGEHIPVTVLQLTDCQVVAQRTEDKNGYTALQLGVGKAKVKNISRAERGHFAVANVEPKMQMAEFRVSEDNLIEVGAEITADHFVPGQFIDVTGNSIGKGFAGRYETTRIQWFAGFPRGVDQSPQSWFDGTMSGSRQSLQGQENGRADGIDTGDHAKLAGRQNRCRAWLDSCARCRARFQRRMGIRQGCGKETSSR